MIEWDRMARVTDWEGCGNRARFVRLWSERSCFILRGIRVIELRSYGGFSLSWVGLGSERRGGDRRLDGGEGAYLDGRVEGLIEGAYLDVSSVVWSFYVEDVVGLG